MHKDLLVERSCITSLPATLWVGGDLMMRRSRIGSLPEGFQAHRGLDLTSTPIKALPEGLSVQGNLNIWDTPIQRLPENLHVGGAILPTPNLADIQAFMQGQPNRVCLGIKGSQHHRMEERARLHPFPDLLRVVAALPAQEYLCLKRDTQGGLHVETFFQSA